MEQQADQINAEEQERRDAALPRTRYLGHVVSCDGARATVAAVTEQSDDSFAARWSVGRLVSIDVGSRRVVAIAVSMQTDDGKWKSDTANNFTVNLELMGEVGNGRDGVDFFSSGISNYPYIGSPAHEIRASDLKLIYDTENSDNCVIGKLSQNETIDASIHMPSMLSKHFAIVGSTGVGKSTAVSLLLHHAIASDPQLRVLILDPHNEFAAAFPDHSVQVDVQGLDLPFWLMRLEEFVEVIFRGRTPVQEEVEVLRELIPEAKKQYRSELGFSRRQAEKTVFTPDSAMPYRIVDLMAMVDERIGRLEGRDEKPMLRALKLRLVSAIGDPNYRFMFSGKTISDSITDAVASIFRIPGDGRPLTTLQLAGIPSEVVNCLASVLCRMAFETAVASHGGYRILVICEEAHRYIPADVKLGFAPTRAAIARIAKEGRKYGASIGVITQRPGELDPTILSQCSTFYAMRLTNDRDKEIVRNAVPDSTSSIVNFISSIGNGEAIAFGEALPIPMRVKFERVNPYYLPKAVHRKQTIDQVTDATADLNLIVKRMRSFALSDGIPTLDGMLSIGEERRPQTVQEPTMTELEPYRPEMLSGIGMSQKNPDFMPLPVSPDRSAIRRDAEASLRDNPFRRPMFDKDRR